MHQKKSEAQIGTESICISSDFNPKPLQIPPSTLTQKHPHLSHNYHTNPYYNNNPSSSSSSSSSSSTNPPHQTLQIIINDDDNDTSVANVDSKVNNKHAHQVQKRHALSPRPTPFKRPQFFAKSPTLSNTLNRYGVHGQSPPSRFNLLYIRSQKVLTHLHHHFRYLRRRIRLHLRLILLLCLPFFYFLVSHPSSSFILDFLSAFAFSAALLFSLNLAIPRLPTIRLFLARSLPIKISGKDRAGRNSLPVFWSIGSRQKTDKKAITGCYVQAYSNGDVYEGEFHKGKFSGNGVYYYYMTGRYEGDWVDGKYDGYGVETWARGSRYRGQYRQGLRHGFGVYRFYTGDVNAGEWYNGQSHGCGVHTCEDGSKYVGEFKWGVKHGLGHYHFRNGDRYAGEYFADKMHGFGIYWFANGHRYEGAWHEGRRQGLGMYSFRNGETRSGHWQDGILDVPSTQSTVFPVSPVAVNHSKVLNIVQEARRAAEKAYEVAKVDERVNRAVSAANRAANAARVAAVKAVQKQMHRRSNSDEIPVPLIR